MLGSSSGWRRWRTTWWAAAALAAWPAAAQVEGRVDEPTGVATYTIPILVPPGTAGTGPSLSLVYASGEPSGGAGWVGLGWTLAGIGAVERDRSAGVPFDYGAPCGNAYCYRDAFVLDGQPLRCAEHPCDGRYKTERDDGRRIERTASGWVVQDRDGRRFHYGLAPAAQLVNERNGQVFAWLLDRVEDVHGNWLEVRYDVPPGKGVAYPVAVEYAQAGAPANRRVAFATEPREDRWIDYRAGLRREVDRRLRAIEVTAAAGALVTRYELEYVQAPDSRRSLLARVRRVGSDEVTALPPHRFEYALGERRFERAARDYCDRAPCYLIDYASASSAFPSRSHVDLDRDGLLDVYLQDPDLRSGPGEVYLGDGDGTSEAAVWTHAFAPFAAGWRGAWAGGSSIEMTHAVIDVSGDGYPDALSQQEGVRLGGPDGFVEPPLPFSLPVFSTLDALWSSLGYQRVDVERTHLHATLVDVNADGLRDAVFTAAPGAGSDWPWPDDPLPRPWRVHLNRGVVGGRVEFSAALLWSDPLAGAFAQGRQVGGTSTELEVSVTDLNGDGIPDRVRGEQVGRRHRLWVAYGNGAGFDAEELAVEIDYTAWPDEPWYQPPPPPEPVVPRRVELGCVYMDLVDLNGDGFPDLVQSELAREVDVLGDPGAPAWLVRFGTGSGLRADAVRWETRDAQQATSNDYRCVYGVGPYAGLHGWAGGLQDFDGDGLLDRHQHTDDLVYLQPGPRADLLVRAVAPLGGSIAFEYGSSARMRNPAGGRANPGLAPPRSVVVRATVSDGRAGTPDVVDTLHYAQGVYDYAAGAFRGFGKVTRTEMAGGAAAATVVSSYKTDRACAGRLARRDVRSQGGLLARETRGYLRSHGPQAVAAAKRWTACLLEVELAQALEGEAGSGRLRKTVRRYGPDPAARHYNVLRVEEWGEVSPDGADVPGDERFTDFAYATPLEPGSHLVSRVASRAVRETQGGVPVAYTRVFYDGLPVSGLVRDGLVTRVERKLESPDEPGASRWVATRREYDAYGNEVSEVGPATDDDPDGLRTESDYDPTYLSFVTATRVGADAPHPLERSVAFDGCAAGLEAPPGLGLACSTADPRGVGERLGYDALGRRIRAERRGGLVESVGYELGAAAGESVVTRRLELGDGEVLTAREWLDGLGRAFAQEGQGKRDEVIRVERSFDARGRLARETLPHFAGSAAPLAASVRYDALGRASQAVDVDGETRVAWSYAPWRVVAEVYFGPPSPASRQSRVEVARDGRGRAVAATRYADAVRLEGAVTARATYTALDRVRHVHDPIGSDPDLCRAGDACETQDHREERHYDTLGRRVRVDHPDAGTRRFRYDEAGRLVEQVDAAGRRRRVSYDALGRVASRRFEPSGDGTYDADYVYADDPADPAFGLLTAVIGAGPGTDYAFGYDAAGWVTSVRQQTAGLAFTHSFARDALGRVVLHTFPDGERYTRVYDGTRLVEIRGDALDVLTDADYDALGRVERLVVGRTPAVDPDSAAVTLERSYDPATARLARMTAAGRTAAAGASGLELDLELDGLGRLLGQDGRAGGRKLGARAFGYDGLGRLTAATGQWERLQGSLKPVTWSYTYDPLGNLRARDTSTGRHQRVWRYEHPTKPHFLTHFVEGAGRGAVVAADAAGRPAEVTLVGQRWNAQGRWHRSEALASPRYAYDAFGRRVLEVIPHQTRIAHAGRDFEYDTALELATKSFFVNGERIASRSTRYRAERAGAPAAALRLAARASTPICVAGALAALLGLTALGRRRLATAGVAALSAALVLWPAGRGGAAIDWVGGPTWHGGHAEELLVYAGDHLGSPRAVFDATGAVVETRDYGPFGASLTHRGAFSLKHRFTGQPFDAGTGRYHHGARQYAPDWSRFVSPDEWEPDLTAPDRNPYAYVHNRPTSLTDPDGRAALLIAGTAGVVLAAVSYLALHTGHPGAAVVLGTPAAVLMTASGFGAAAGLLATGGTAGSALAAGLYAGLGPLSAIMGVTDLSMSLKQLEITVEGTGVSVSEIVTHSQGKLVRIDVLEVGEGGVVTGTAHFDNGDVVEIVEGRIGEGGCFEPEVEMLKAQGPAKTTQLLSAPGASNGLQNQGVLGVQAGYYLDPGGVLVNSVAIPPWVLSFYGFGCCGI